VAEFSVEDIGCVEAIMRLTYCLPNPYLKEVSCVGPATRYVAAAGIVAAVVAGVLAAFLWVNLSDLRVRYGVLATKYSGLEERYGELSSKYSALRSGYEGLKANYTLLKHEYVSLNSTYVKLLKEHEGLLRNYTSLREEYASLTTKYSELSKNYAELRTNYSRLKAAYSGVVAQLNTLSRKYSALESNYSALSEKYYALHDEYLRLARNYTSLTSKYSALRARYSNLLTAIEALMNATRERGGLDDSFKPNYIDWWSTPVEEAVKSINFNAYGDPYRAIYDWIITHVTYNYDTPEVIITSPNATYEWRSDYYQYASETLSNGYGDCEDQAILAAAMVEAYWHWKYGETYLVYVAEVIVKYGSIEGGHDFLIIPFQGGYAAIIDPAAHVYIPPTKTLTALQEYERVAGWKITYVYGAFNLNEYYHLRTSSLQEFAQWLNSS